MAAVTTKKPDGDLALQMTFPAIFSDAAALERMPFAYYPDPVTRPPVLAISNDLQGYYHQQKQLDADRMVKAAVESKQKSDYRLLHSHANYYGMPKPVLSQRVYANPSLGNQSDIYSTRPALDSLAGGVLYTRQAQQWGRRKLRDRINQLNAIDFAKAGFLTGATLTQAPIPVGVTAPSIEDTVAAKSKIELVQTLQAIANSAARGVVSNFDYQNMIKFLRLLFRWASTADVEELKEVLEYIDEIQEDLRGIEDALEEGEDANGEQRRFTGRETIMTSTMASVREYVSRMISVANRSIPERKAASANFIKSLGFTSFKQPPARIAQRMEQDQVDTMARVTGLPAVAFDGSDDSNFDEIEAGRRAAAEMPVSIRDAFDSFGRRIRDARFDPSVREVMGANNGAYLGEDIPAGVGVGVRNAMRRLPEAEIDVTAATREAPLPAFETTATTAVAPATPARRYTVPEGLTRDSLPTTTRGLRDLLTTLSDRGYGTYNPHEGTSYPVIRRGIINRWKL